MLLRYTDGTPFATGAAVYFDVAGETEVNPRIWLTVKFQNLNVTAIVDTGAPYVVCSPELAEVIGLIPGPGDPRIRLSIRGAVYDGHLIRFELAFLATEGDDLEIQASAFVPDVLPGETWSVPNFLGLNGCLERIRFAVDPVHNVFYFGGPGDSHE